MNTPKKAVTDEIVRSVHASPQVVCSMSMSQESLPSESQRSHPPAIPTEELEDVWGTIGQAGSSTRVRSSGTIVPLDHTEMSLSEAIREKLPRYSLGSSDNRPVDLAMGEVIGEGAMGIVHAAEQVPVNREVAVKTVRPEAIKHNAHLELLREGWTTGRLEHPNIIPIYGIGRDANDLPLLVMKRIEGKTWHHLLHGADNKLVDRTGRSRMAFHIGKLIQVCNAVHFAHSRGILHRDLKPENVMIGEFGEVYVLDWGIAVSLQDEALLPRAADVTTVAGTPDYMAPEMTTGKGSLLSEQTDVFLLGAMLHELITGQPPNTGESLFEKIYAAARCEPRDYDSAVDEELIGIIRKAMSYNPADRYENAAALRDALAQYLSHISSRELASESLGRVSAMEYLLGDTHSDLDEEEHQQLTNLFTEARFGFKQALRTWSANPVAKRGLRRVLEMMADYELRRGGVSAAVTLLAELSPPNAALMRRLADLRAQKAREEDRLIAMDLALDDSTKGTGVAAVAFGLLLAITGIGFLTMSALDSSQALNLTALHLGTLTASATLVVILFRVTGGPLLWRRRVARRMLDAQALVGLAWCALWLNAFLAPADMHPTVREALDETAQHAILAGWACLGISAIVFDRRFLIPALCMFAAHPIALVDPRYTMEAFGGACVAGAAVVAVTWRPKLMVEDPDAL